MTTEPTAQMPFPDPSKEESWQFHDEYEFWYIPMPETTLRTFRGKNPYEWQDRGFEPWKLFARPQPDGYKLVPIEPTEKMIDGTVFDLNMLSGWRWVAKKVYRAMLAAAPDVEPETK